MTQTIIIQANGIDIGVAQRLDIEEKRSGFLGDDKIYSSNSGWPYLSTPAHTIAKVYRQRYSKEALQKAFGKPFRTNEFYDVIRDTPLTFKIVDSSEQYIPNINNFRTTTTMGDARLNNMGNSYHHEDWIIVDYAEYQVGYVDYGVSCDYYSPPIEYITMTIDLKEPLLTKEIMGLSDTKIEPAVVDAGLTCTITEATHFEIVKQEPKPDPLITLFGIAGTALGAFITAMCEPSKEPTARVSANITDDDELEPIAEPLEEQVK